MDRLKNSFLPRRLFTRQDLQEQRTRLNSASAASPRSQSATTDASGEGGLTTPTAARRGNALVTTQPGSPRFTTDPAAPVEDENEENERTPEEERFFVSRYGRIVDKEDDSATNAQPSVQQREVELRREKKWLTMYSTWTKSPPNAQLVKERTRKGIPESLRGVFWPLFADAIEVKHAFYAMHNMNPHASTNLTQSQVAFNKVTAATDQLSSVGNTSTTSAANATEQSYPQHRYSVSQSFAAGADDDIDRSTFKSQNTSRLPFLPGSKSSSGGAKTAIHGTPGLLSTPSRRTAAAAPAAANTPATAPQSPMLGLRQSYGRESLRLNLQLGLGDNEGPVSPSRAGPSGPGLSVATTPHSTTLQPVGLDQHKSSDRVPDPSATLPPPPPPHLTPNNGTQPPPLSPSSSIVSNRHSSRDDLNNPNAGNPRLLFPPPPPPARATPSGTQPGPPPLPHSRRSFSSSTAALSFAASSQSSSAAVSATNGAAGAVSLAVPQNLSSPCMSATTVGAATSIPLLASSIAAPQPPPQPSSSAQPPPFVPSSQNNLNSIAQQQQSSQPPQQQQQHLPIRSGQNPALAPSPIPIPAPIPPPSHSITIPSTHTTFQMMADSPSSVGETNSPTHATFFEQQYTPHDSQSTDGGFVVISPVALNRIDTLHTTTSGELVSVPSGPMSNPPITISTAHTPVATNVLNSDRDGGNKSPVHGANNDTCPTSNRDGQASGPNTTADDLDIHPDEPLRRRNTTSGTDYSPQTQKKSIGLHLHADTHESTLLSSSNLAPYMLAPQQQQLQTSLSSLTLIRDGNNASPPALPKNLSGMGIEPQSTQLPPLPQQQQTDDYDDINANRDDGNRGDGDNNNDDDDNDNDQDETSKNFSSTVSMSNQDISLAQLPTDLNVVEKSTLGSPLSVSTSTEQTRQPKQSISLTIQSLQEQHLHNTFTLTLPHNQEPLPSWSLYRRLAARPSAHDVLITKDVTRTFADHILFSSQSKKDSFNNRRGRQSLADICRAYSHLDPQLGYCQGISFLVAILLMYMEAEDAFWVLVCMLQHPRFALRGFFTHGFPLLEEYTFIIKGLLAQLDQRVHRKLADLDFNFSLCLPQWFMGLFVYVMPLHIGLRIWDIMFCEGIKVLFRTSLQMVLFNRRTILNCTDLDELNMCMSRLTRDTQMFDDCDKFIHSVNNVNIKSETILALRRQYRSRHVEIASELLTPLELWYRSESTAAAGIMTPLSNRTSSFGPILESHPEVPSAQRSTDM